MALTLTRITVVSQNQEVLFVCAFQGLSDLSHLQPQKEKQLLRYSILACPADRTQKHTLVLRQKKKVLNSHIMQMLIICILQVLPFTA